ncbi:succinate dehydrogenase assembly factor 2 [Marinagarivorans cellulosilyticus]|uniref:FAD assembly factor SdhE n=1 Tax=Marinagarivorans cellulosilyticus TaxID=2721545 RepID=A0AAN1WFE3_9GAMM|nr:succinate dehydrogenase assembly factor 2 [Marinagarivorans cellulosilyticus]BCD96608.1 antitoxin CptB [Marinagarivorans cellulosilyticus]
MEYNRLKWASRRGMLELDLVLMPFLENVYQTLPPEDQALYVELLTNEDQDMFGWLLKHKEPPTEGLKRIVAIVMDNTGLKV